MEKKKIWFFRVPFLTLLMGVEVFFATLFRLDRVFIHFYIVLIKSRFEDLIAESSKQLQFSDWNFFNFPRGKSLPSNETKPLINYIKMTITLFFSFSRAVPLFVCLQNINKNLWQFFLPFSPGFIFFFKNCLDVFYFLLVIFFRIKSLR